jgi:DNA-binding sugar fermentation-stimulating protein
MNKVKIFCPIYNSLINSDTCNNICNNKIEDNRIKNINNYKTICERCKFHNDIDDKTINVEAIQNEIKRLKDARSKNE